MEDNIRMILLPVDVGIKHIARGSVVYCNMKKSRPKIPVLSVIQRDAVCKYGQ